MRLAQLCLLTGLAACGSTGTQHDTSRLYAADRLETADPARMAPVDRVEFGLRLNDVRGPAGIVSADPILTGVAQEYSRDIERHGRRILDGDDLHVGRDGSTAAERVLAAGYDYEWVGENIAQGYRRNEAVIDAWLGSGSHREVLLEPRAEDFGIGRTDTTWVLLMGAER